MKSVLSVKVRGRPVPFLLPLAAALVGILFSLFWPISLLWLSGAAVSVFGLAVLFIKKKPSLMTGVVFLVVIFFGFGYLHSSQRHPAKNSIVHLLPSRGVLIGEAGYSLRRITVQAREFRREGTREPVSGRVVVYYRGIPPPPGSKVKIEGEFYRPPMPVNPGQFNYANHLAHEGIFAAVRSEKVELMQQFQPGKTVGKIRSYTSAAIREYFTPPYSDAMLSMFLGDPSSMTPGILEDFRKAGITHILAVSGLHVGLVLFIFYSFLSSPGISRKSALFISLLLMWVFVLVTGLRPSAMRAALMVSFAAAGYIIGGRGNVFNGLAAAAFIILTFSPGLLFTAGFQLSFLAVLGIVYLGPVLSSFLGKALGISTGAVLFILPLLGRSFNYLPLGAPLVNLAVIPLASLALASLFVFLFLIHFFPPAAVIYARAAEVFTGGIVLLASIVSRSGLAGVRSPSPSLFLVGGIYLFLLGAGVLNSKNRKLLISAGAAVIFLSVLLPAKFSRPYIAAISGEDSPSFIVSMKRGEAVLFAGRGRLNVDAVLSFMRSRGEMRLKHIYIVHPPFYGLDPLAEIFFETSAETVFYSGETGSPLDWELFKEKIGAEKIYAARAGDIVDYGSWEFKFTEPDKKYLDIRDNYMQGVVRGKKSLFIYAGGEIPHEKFDAVIVMDPYRPDWAKLKKISQTIIYSGKISPEAGIWVNDKGKFIRL